MIMCAQQMCMYNELSLSKNGQIIVDEHLNNGTSISTSVTISIYKQR